MCSKNIMKYLTIDLESWIHRDFNLINSYKNYDIEKRKELDNEYIRESTERILLQITKIKHEENLKIIFFIVGDIYEWYPELVEKISKNFDIGFHTFSHSRLVTDQVLIDELNRGKEFISEYDIKWFRAPEIFIKRSHFKILQDHGFEIDSSTYGVTRPYFVDNITELPVSTYRYGKNNNKIPNNLTLGLLKNEIPFGCGLFLKILPVSMIQNYINYYKTENIDLMLFFHPWQIYPAMRGNFIWGLPRSLLATGYFMKLDFAKIESLICDKNMNYYKE